MLVNKVTLNGKTGGASVATDWIGALNDPRLVREKAGFLFKASFEGGHLMLAVAPTLINGERSYHYNMHLKKEDAFTLLGDVNAEGIFSLLFKPDHPGQFRAESSRFVGVCHRFAGFLIENGYAGKGMLNEVTQGLLEAAGLSPAPQVLADLQAGSADPHAC